MRDNYCLFDTTASETEKRGCARRVSRLDVYGIAVSTHDIRLLAFTALDSGTSSIERLAPPSTA